MGKVVFFIRDLHNVMGGAEKQTLKIVKNLSKIGFKILIITLDPIKPKIFFEDFSDNLSIIGVGQQSTKIQASFLERLNRQIKVFKILRNFKPNTAIAIMTGGFFFSILPCRILRIPVILAERNSPSMYNLTSIKRYKNIIFIVMSLSTKIVVQFERYIWMYPNYLRKRIVSINNQIDIPKSKNDLKGNNFVFVFAGRFSFQKQIVELIESFAIHTKSYPDSILHIYGQGELENIVKSLIFEKSLTNEIKIFNPEFRIERVLNKVDVLCIPSLWEGFPNILAESLMCGIPGVGFEDCDGVSDLIIDGYNGWLVPRPRSTFAFALKLNEIREVASLKVIKENAIESVEKYSSGETYQKWMNLIMSVQK